MGGHTSHFPLSTNQNPQQLNTHLVKSLSFEVPKDVWTNQVDLGICNQLNFTKELHVKKQN